MNKKLSQSTGKFGKLISDSKSEHETQNQLIWIYLDYIIYYNRL